MKRLIACLALVLPLLIGGCGFKPMYGQSSGIGDQLAGTRVETEDGRPAYALGLALRDELGSWQGEPRYILRTRLDTSRRSQSITVADIATRYELNMTVNYGLYDAVSGDLVASGRKIGRAAYDVPRDPYATIRAEQESEELAARDAAHQIVIALARELNSADAP